MTKNFEVFLKDPTTFTIPNEGVAKILNPQTEQQWEVLRYELTSFVCEGEYQKGLERILSTFLGNLDRPEQPAVWVSGFYGSGKSHVVRVLEYLWRDIEFPDGARARSLTSLPQEILDYLKELSTAGKRAGGLWSAAGTLGASANNSVKLALLRIVFMSANLPEKYPLARFVIWLKQNGYYQKVEKYVKGQGKDLHKELNNLYVSPYIAKGLLQAYPGFAGSEAEARGLLKAQYPNVEDISDDEFLETLEYVLELQSDGSGKLPLTLLIFDELQQFLGEDSNKTLQLQNVVELCSSRLGSRLIFVSTGQAALEATPQLSKLQARFRVRVTLEDKDVDRVVRDVVLRKKPGKTAELKAVLESASGEIDRHLVGTKLAVIAADKDTLIADYPLLPTRRRFWEGVLRAIDPAGTGGQLRTQLRMVHEAAREIAKQPLGTVVPADSIYDQQKANMLQSAVLLRDMANTIEQLNDRTEDGKLRSRLCATIFLIDKLPTTGVAAPGLKASVNVLADLLVEDLKAGSSALRQKIPGLLTDLVDNGTLMFVGDAYHLQTPESAEWQAEYRKAYAQIRADDSRIASDRADALKKAVTQALKGMSLIQGQSKTPRKHEILFGLDIPRPDGSNVPVWVRDEWTVSEKNVREDAQQAGVESPVVFVFLPKRDSDKLRDALAGFAAANRTIERRGNVSTPEGVEAKKGMESRLEIANREVQTIIADIIRNARVYQGGGNEIVEDGFAETVKIAVEASLTRLFPKFGMADHARWGEVVVKAREGAADALHVIGYQGDAEKHPVCQDVRNFIGHGGSGKKGSEIRRYFSGNGYGWPQDAIDGALFALLAGGAISAKQGGISRTAKGFVQSQVTVTEFFGEGVAITASQRLAVRKLLTDAKYSFKPNEELTAVAPFLQMLVDLANEIGGAPPLPLKPVNEKLDELRSMSGNEQFAGVYEAREQLLSWHKDWTRAKDKREKRLPRWEMLQRLVHHGASLEGIDQVEAQVESIVAERSLLSDPDPLDPILNDLVSELRTALKDVQKRYKKIHDSLMEILAESPEWKKIGKKEQTAFLNECSVRLTPDIQVGSAQELLDSLDAIPLDGWEDLIAALPVRVENARSMAVKKLEPQAVRITLPSRTLKTEADVDAYLAEIRKDMMKHIKGGKPIIL